MTSPSRLQSPLEHANPRLADAVYDRVGQAILDGTFEPGSRIRDAEIADALGVSRMPVREALQRLERAGLVEMSASRYTRVTEVTSELAESTLVYVGYQLGVAARLAVPRMDDTTRAEVIALLERMTELPESDDLRAFYATADEFFRLLTRETGNAVFIRSADEARLFVYRNLLDGRLAPLAPEVLSDVLPRLVAAIVAKDGREAEGIIRSQYGLDL